MKKLLCLAMMAMPIMASPISVQAETSQGGPGPDPSEQKPASSAKDKTKGHARDHAKHHKAAEKLGDKEKPAEQNAPAQQDAKDGAAVKDQVRTDLAQKDPAKKESAKKDHDKDVAKKDKQLAPHPDEYDAMIAEEARKHGVPESLIHRIVMRESRYEPTAFHRVYFGLMQITYATAHGMGYDGAPKGLLDAATNLAYAVPYLANAYIVADKNPDRAVQLYAGGYYYEAKRKHKLGLLRTAKSEPVEPPVTKVAQTEPPPPANPVSRLFGALLGAPAPQPQQQQAAAPQEQAQAAGQAQAAQPQQTAQTSASNAAEPVKVGSETAAAEPAKDNADKPLKTASAHHKDHPGKAPVKLAAKTSDKPAGKPDAAQTPATQTAAVK